MSAHLLTNHHFNTSSGPPSAEASAALKAVATALTTVTASLGSLLDGGAAQVDVGKLLAGIVASFDADRSGLGLNPGECMCSVCMGGSQAGMSMLLSSAGRQGLAALLQDPVSLWRLT